jgi:tetratricopeptide (TPR) repeat protein
MRWFFGRSLALAACALLLMSPGCNKDKKKKTTPDGARSASGDANPDANGGDEPAAGGSSARESGSGPVVTTTHRPDARSGSPTGPRRISVRPFTRPRRPTLGKEKKIKLIPMASIKRLIVGKQYKRAIGEAKKHLEVNEKSVPAMAAMAEAYFRKGELELCKAVLASINALQKDHPLFLYLWGHLYLKDGSYALAVKYFEQAVQKNPRLLDAWTMIGVRYLQGGSYQKALNALLKAKRLPGGYNYSISLNIGSCYRGLAHRSNNTSYYVTSLNYYVEAEKLYRRAGGAGNLTYVAALYNKAILYLDAKKFPGYTKVRRLQTGLKYLQMYVVLAPRKNPGAWAKEKKRVKALLNKVKNADLPAAKAMAQAAAAQARATPRPTPQPRRRTPPGPPPR